MNTKILVVEDEPTIVTLLEYNLTKAGYKTDVVDNGEDAVHTLRRYTYDLVLLDLMLPILNGLDVSRMIRHDKLEVPILMLTAKDSEQDRIRGLEAGADDYLNKPFSPRELLLRIKAILSRTQYQNISQLSAESVYGRPNGGV